jgi:hypothetical protein
MPCAAPVCYSRMLFLGAFYNRSMLILFSPSFSLFVINFITFLHISSFQVDIPFA